MLHGLMSWRQLTHCLQATHYTGKWDCGMATEAHTPRGRGYDTSLFYFHHDNVGTITARLFCPRPRPLQCV
jgi:hypothetical protein